MRILVTGANGQLGYDLIKELEAREITALGVDIEDIDITDAHGVKHVIEEANVDAVIHCAAYTAVDAAEDNVDLCMDVNEKGTINIAKVCKELDIKMMYISTDYVFNGEGDTHWKPEDDCSPINVYGESKYKGELVVKELLDKFFIIRISWVFGVNGNNFVKTMLRLSKTNKEISVVNDQVGSPTYTADLAILLSDMIVTEKYGIYHATNEGFCTWYEFAVEIFNQGNIDILVHPIKSEAYPTKAKRPQNSRLDKSKLATNGFKLLPPWQDAVKRYISDIATPPL